MADCEIVKGRILVGAKMGEGYEEYNDPTKVIDFYGDQIRTILAEGRRHKGLPPYKVDDSGLIELGSYRIADVPKFGIHQVVDRDLEEQFLAIGFELDFLTGRYKGEEPEWLD